MIQVAGPTTISIKKAKPSVDKEVYDNADGNAAAGWVEAADHTINETFQFRLTATIPADAESEQPGLQALRSMAQMSLILLIQQMPMPVIPERAGH